MVVVGSLIDASTHVTHSDGTIQNNGIMFFLRSTWGKAFFWT